ncbi:MAG TPA: hypothetical protein VHE23_03675 [Candidatus Acidoferrales bacterium]|nr:hypothetical protein [Candidatus Acidoferrales bacterium]
MSALFPFSPLFTPAGVFRFTSVALTWYVLFGAVTTFAVGAAVSRLESAQAVSPPHSGAA